ncbi:GNAT family N-acetyltransferase [Oxalobacteraceae bacterium]|nr:GNAT family N-acetyltransferase [Oxalobacteraceae bacterium]
MHSNLNIRPLTPSDALAFQALRLKSIADSPTSFWATYEEEAGRTESELRSRLEANASQVVFGAFHGPELIGAAGLRRETMRQVAHKGFLWGVCVDPDARRGGVARQMLAALIEHARGIGLRQLNLGVNTSNTRALNLYHTLGFTSFGTEPGSTLVAGQLYDEELMYLQIA